MPATVAISSDFFMAFAALPKQTQSKVSDFIGKFQANPKSPGINYEKIKEATDNKICSVRIDETYRGIVVRQEETGVYLLLWVDHHDEAYEWARRKKCTVNQKTGNIQVYDVQYEAEVNIVSPNAVNGLFSQFSTRDLQRIGVPDEQVMFVQKIRDFTDFYNSKSSLPADAYENLEWLANDFSISDVLSMIEGSSINVAENDLGSALSSFGTKKSFYIVSGEDELSRIMADPLEKWRVFLHPTQRKAVENIYSGPARVLGGAGTGKTVVAMHRARFLASKMTGSNRILFTTFTANLAADIKENLKALCTAQEFRHIEVVNLDAWVYQYLKSSGYGASIIYDEPLNAIWEEAVQKAEVSVDFTASFYFEEWTKVVAAQDAFTKELYLKAHRIGRDTRLDRKKRIQVWCVFDEYLKILRARGCSDIDTALYECRKIAESDLPAIKYPHIIVDEGQDISPNAYRLLRVLAGEEHNNDLFIVGDTHQRIYKNKATLSKCDINIRGRSIYLRINYRTTEEIRKYAFALLKGIPFDDLDEDYDDGRVCQSLTHGEMPSVRNFKDATSEHAFIVSEIKNLIGSGVDAKSICVVTRTHKLLNDYIAQLLHAGLRVYEIKRGKLDDRNYDGIRIATMHRVKGLEFGYMFVAAVNNRVMPLAPAIGHTDSPSKVESTTTERSLLYVALTRAQKKAYITSYGTPSEFLN
jgi:superfamily I DNA/RNA helicase/mRNA-degrading endonuclease RelE of RelBE toxin-antitoxin system